MWSEKTLFDQGAKLDDIVLFDTNVFPLVELDSISKRPDADEQIRKYRECWHYVHETLNESNGRYFVTQEVIKELQRGQNILRHCVKSSKKGLNQGRRNMKNQRPGGLHEQPQKRIAGEIELRKRIHAAMKNGIASLKKYTVHTAYDGFDERKIALNDDFHEVRARLTPTYECITADSGGLEEHRMHDLRIYATACALSAASDRLVTICTKDKKVFLGIIGAHQKIIAYKHHNGQPPRTYNVQILTQLDGKLVTKPLQSQDVHRSENGAQRRTPYQFIS